MVARLCLAGVFLAVSAAGCSSLVLVPGGHCVATEAQAGACRAGGAGCFLTYPPEDNPCRNVGARCTDAYVASQLDERRLPCLCTCSAEYKARAERLRQQDPTLRGGEPRPPDP